MVGRSVDVEVRLIAQPPYSGEAVGTLGATQLILVYLQTGFFHGTCVNGVCSYAPMLQIGGPFPIDSV